MRNPMSLSDEEVFNNMNDLDKAQIVLQLVMTKYSCNESEAKTIIDKKGVNIPGLFATSAPTFKKID